MKYPNLLADYDDILTTKDVQEFLHIGRNTLYDYLATGKIKSLKIGGKYKIPKIYLLQFIYPEIDFTKEIEEGWRDQRRMEGEQEEFKAKEVDSI